MRGWGELMLIKLRSDGHQTEHRAAFLAGLTSLGVKDLGEDVAVVWGYKEPTRLLQKLGYRVLVFERGYLGDRFKYTSIAWNGLNGRAQFPGYHDDGGERFRKCGFELKPWRDDGDAPLVIGQVPTDAAVYGSNHRAWCEDAVKRAREHYGVKPIFRPHPEAVKRYAYFNVDEAVTDFGDLEDAITRASTVITYSSNTAVDALIAGRDAVAMDSGSMAYEVAAKDIGGAVNRDAREQWAHRLAWKQWAIEEIASGEALKEVVGQFLA